MFVYTASAQYLSQHALPYNNDTIVEPELAMLGEPHLLFKQLHYPLQIMLVCANWYGAYPLSLRHIDELMNEQSFFIDHAAVRRYSLKILPVSYFVLCRVQRAMGKC